MLFAGTYMLNLLCAIVPCQASMRPPEAYIADLNGVSSPTKSNDTDFLKFPQLADPAGQKDRIAQQRLKRVGQLQTQNMSSRVRYQNLENPLKVMMDAFQRGIERGGGYTHNFGNKFVPFPVTKNPAGKRSVINNNRIDGNDQDTIVYLRNGDAVEGYYMGTMKGSRFMAFQGIPYAEPPVGNLRFRPPVPKRPWLGLLRATRAGSECLQGHPISMFRISGSEDCLFLNVYTPKTSSSATKRDPFPVIFFIHGGSFLYGSGSEYGPTYLLDQDVILVTINYRLGALGFMTTGDLHCLGNFGLKDQALALQWTYDNIEQFGGDPKRITMMGQSAGGISAHLHLIANKTTHLFQNGISLSGSAFGFWPVVPRQRALGFTKRLAKNLRCPDANNGELLQCLRSKPPNYIVGAQLHFFKWIPFHPLIVFGPVVEPEGRNAYLTKSPGESYALGEVTKKPWIFGQTFQEGHFETYFVNLFMQTPILTARVRDLLPVVLDYQEFTKEPERSELTEKIIKFYGSKEDGNAKKFMDVISDMYTDRLFTNGIQQSIRTHGSIAPTFAYVFDYKGNYNLGQVFGAAKSEWGSVHTEDVFFIFNSSVFHDGFRRSDPEYELSQVMTNLISNYARHSQPVYTNIEGHEIKIWDEAVPPSDKSNGAIINNSITLSDQPIQYLQLNRTIQMMPDPYAVRNRFWKSLKIPI